MFPGPITPSNESSWERKFPVTFVLGSESSQWELSLRGAKILGSEVPEPAGGLWPMDPNALP